MQKELPEIFAKIESGSIKIGCQQDDQSRLPTDLASHVALCDTECRYRDEEGSGCLIDCPNL